MTYIRHQVTYQGARITYGGNCLNFPVRNRVVNNLDVPAGWLIPTEAELEEERSSWSSDNLTAAFASPLKLTFTGHRQPSTGNLFGLTSFAYYWSSTVSSVRQEDVRQITIYTSVSWANLPRGFGRAIRLIKQKGLPLVSGDQTFTYNGASWTYREVESLTGRIWMDRNLGASQVATAVDDLLAYGDLFQWGRNIDGHQVRTSGTTTILSSSDTPGHGDFILTGPRDYNWRSPRNDNLWQPI